MDVQTLNVSKPLVKPQQSKAQNLAFRATLPEIQQAVDSSDKLCPGKKSFFNNLVEIFTDFQSRISDKLQKDPGTPAKFEFKLGERNVIPDSLKDIKVEVDADEGKKLNITLADLDKQLNESSFSCGSDSHCKCGKGKSLGEFVKEIFQKMLKLEKPDIIELNADK